jgi:cytosine/adenosine deaminase-related metal-dependent hydrolase
MPDSDAIALTARYVFPVAGPPIAGGCVTVRGERIAAVGARPSSEAVDLGNVAILPGFVNAHTHLEFSDLAVPLGQPGMPLPEWIRHVIATRRPQNRNPAASIQRGLAESLRSGTTTIGDIATSGWGEQTIAEASLDVTVFYESIGLARERMPERLADAQEFVATALGSQTGHSLQIGLSPHAPYSVHADLVAGLARLAASRGLPVAMHLAESREELELLATGGGPFRDLLAELGAWDAGAIPGGTRPLDYLRLLAGAPRALVIHGNYLDAEEVAFLADRRGRMSVVYCPRTHAYFGHARYPLERLLGLDVAVALGTDSRASNPDLGMLAEMRHVARAFPAIAPETVLRLGTLAGAQALGRAHEAGTIEPEKLANLTIVALPDQDGRDPHELLFNSRLPVVATYYRGSATLSVV